MSKDKRREGKRGEERKERERDRQRRETETRARDIETVTRDTERRDKERREKREKKKREKREKKKREERARPRSEREWDFERMSRAATSTPTFLYLRHTSNHGPLIARPNPAAPLPSIQALWPGETRVLRGFRPFFACFFTHLTHCRPITACILVDSNY